MTTIAPSPKAFGNSVFCDDIRHEIGGKLTYVGVYNGTMIVHSEFPFTLPKFGIAVTFFERPGMVSGDISFRVFMPGDTDDAPTLTLDAPMGGARDQIVAPKDDPAFPIDQPVRRFDFVFPFAPLVIKQKGMIKVRAFIGDEIFRLGALKVDQQLPPAQPESAPTPLKPRISSCSLA